MNELQAFFEDGRLKKNKSSQVKLPLINKCHSHQCYIKWY